MHMGMDHGGAAAPAEVPPLKILMPGNGDIVGSRLAIVFETPADIGKMTMGHHMIGSVCTWNGRYSLDAVAGAARPPWCQIDICSCSICPRRREPGAPISWAGGNHKKL